MRSAINAVVSFGALWVPVGVAPTASRKEVKFRTLHSECGTPVNQQYICQKCDEVTSEATQVKAYELSKGHFVTVEQQELDAARAPRSAVIEINKFVNIHEIDASRLVDKSYFLVPKPKPLLRPYEIIAGAMTAMGVVGVGKATLWKNEYPVAIDVNEDGVMFMLLLFCADEVRSPVEITTLFENNVTAQEILLAQEYVDLMSSPLTVEDLTAGSHNRVMELINLKAMGAEIDQTPEAPVMEPTLDTMAALKESVAMAQAARK